MKYLILSFVFICSMVSAQKDSLLNYDNQDLVYKKIENSAALSPRLLMQSDFTKNYPYEPLKTDINYPVLAAVGGVFLGSGIAVHIYQRNAWWKDQRQAFHFVNDNNYALGMDKLGHFYAGNLLAHAFSAGLEAGDLTIEQSAIYGSAASLLFELYVEIEDGYGPDWGFSPGDLAGDVLGAAFSLGQYYYPFLKNFQTRFSYLPSDKMRNGTHRGGNIIDDYEGQKYWLSFRMKNLLPEVVSNYWPSFLMLSFGMGVSNLDGAGGGNREFYIALDLDAEEIPLYGKGWQFVKNTLNYFHFPMPGIRVSPDAVFFVICF